jgi:hypothetical protein
MPSGNILTSHAMAGCENLKVFLLNPYVERPLIVGKIVAARTAVAALASAAAAAAAVVEAFVGRVLCTQIMVEK